MVKLSVHDTETAHWYEAVSQAQAGCQLFLPEDMENYLVFLLMRYTQSEALAQGALALDFLESAALAGQAKQLQLQSVGDKCLLYSGLFPGRAQRKLVSVRYFVDLGQTAYGSLAYLLDQSSAPLFTRLAYQFPELASLLQQLRADSDETSLSGIKITH